MPTQQSTHLGTHSLGMQGAALRHSGLSKSPTRKTPAHYLVMLL